MVKPLIKLRIKWSHIRAKLVNLGFISYRCIECKKKLPENWDGYCYECCEKLN